MSVFNCNYSQTRSPHHAPRRVLPAYTYITDASLHVHVSTSANIPVGVHVPLSHTLTPPISIAQEIEACEVGRETAQTSRRLRAGPLREDPGR